MNNKTGNRTRRNDKTAKILSTVFLLIIAALYIYNTYLAEPHTDVVEGVCEFHFIDVGQGDCSLFLTDSNAVVIDAGPKSEAEETTDYIREYTDSLDYFILTHPDEDHIGGAIEIIGKLNVRNIIMSDASKDTQIFTKLLDAIEEKNITVIKAKPGSEYSAGDIKLTVLAPIGEFDDYNDYSVVTRVRYGSTSVIVAGDAEKTSEKNMVESYGRALRSDILKLAHHGSSTSTGKEFFETVSPKYAIISCGKNNSYGHPHEETLKLLDKYGVKYYRTDKEGSIIMTSDGKKIDKK